MPKVIGKDNKFVKQVSCKNCASILEYTESEVEKGKSYDYGGGCDPYKYINCPYCSKKVII
jgi:hypothetical protein